ncbi:phosphomannomutase [Rhodovulum iodosum]|uniref:Phosphomannomutase n=1 Tax=Rhodovulum iodosum TaxID=68291 RepID=A0ABV3XTM4_9RHOB|nr:phosphomannomutase [Rhodovulum robiginosum]RSK30474.1 phosphomannomutase [Rhodovulum robiginosum]
MNLTCFKAYDVRGRIGDNLDTDIARRIGAGFAHVMGARTEGRALRVVVGRDCRESSPELACAVMSGLRDQGAEVLDIGLAGTEEVYFATAHLGATGGIEITASHNPMDYNGMKLVGPGSRPIDPGSELAAIRAAAESDLEPLATPGGYAPVDTRPAFAAHVCDFVEADKLKPMKILVNSGNGTAGPTFDAIAAELARRGAPLDFVRVNHVPDGSFPNGVPNPLLPENRAMTAAPVRAEGAEMGVAWDGDFDRCFLFDEAGDFIDGEYVVALLAQSFLAGGTGETIVYDPRVVLNTRAVIAANGGSAVASKTGHAFVKAKMREVDAVYGGEMSAHHYFRDFYYCDSGMIPWLKIVEYLSRSGQSLGQCVAEMRADFPSSGEINFTVSDPAAVIEAIVAQLGDAADEIDRLDGASLGFADWRMNLRASNTEPLLRLNIETRGDRALLEAKVAELTALVRAAGGPAAAAG